MKILLTGACGVLGRAIQRVGADDHEFVLMDVAEAVEAVGGIRASVTDEAAVDRAAAGCDAIIHTAAMHGSSYGKAPNAEFIRTNVLGAELLFQAALRHGIRRLAVSSTMEVMIGRTWDAYGTAVLDESLPPRPDWIYPLTKLQVEQLGSFYAQRHGLEVVQLRYAAFADRPTERLGLSLLARYIHADDVARANLLAVTRPGLRDAVFHIGPDTPLTQADVNAALTDPMPVIEKHWPGAAAVLSRHDLTPKPTHFWPVMRIDKAKLMLGWQPQVTFATYLTQLGWHAPAEVDQPAEA